MQTKLPIKNIKNGDKFWYIFVGSGKVQLLKVVQDENEDDKELFIVQLTDYGSIDELPMRLSVGADDCIPNLFRYEDRDNAEIWWTHLTLKYFNVNTNIEFGHFLELVEKLKDAHPELILKGL